MTTDGEAVTAEDVVFTFETAKAARASIDLTFLEKVEAVDDPIQSIIYCQIILKVHFLIVFDKRTLNQWCISMSPALTGTTVTFLLSRPTSVFLNTIASGILCHKYNCHLFYRRNRSVILLVRLQNQLFLWIPLDKFPRSRSDW